MSKRPGFSFSWLAAIVLISIIFLAGSARFLQKVSQGSTAYERWREPVSTLADRPDMLKGFPYPTISAILMLPAASLSPIAGGLLWQLGKGISIAAVLIFSLHLASESKPLARQGPVALLAVLATARYITADLTHGNINLFVALLALTGIYAFVRGLDIASGLLLALAAAVKVTPGLLIVYFIYKRQWKLSAAAIVGLVLFLVVVPVLVQGPAPAWTQFTNWKAEYIDPYTIRGEIFSTQINQSLPGVFYRLGVDSVGIDDGDIRLKVNLLNLSHNQARWLIRLGSAAILLAMGYLFRKKITDRAALSQVAEYALVLLAMLILCERTWKAHCVIVFLPAAVLASALWRKDFCPTMRRWLIGLLAAAIILPAATSTDIIGPEAGNYAEAYGVVLLANFLLAAGLIIVHGTSRKQQPTEIP